MLIILHAYCTAKKIFHKVHVLLLVYLFRIFWEQLANVIQLQNWLSAGSGERRQSVESPTDGASKAKGKNRQPKAQVSPSKTMIQCPTCNKAFNNSSALAKHRLTHSDERKYVCSVCQKGFKRQDHL